MINFMPILYQKKYDTLQIISISYKYCVLLLRIMEMIQTEENNGIDELKTAHLVNLLKEINVSTFLDNWGPVHVLHVYNPDTNMRGILVIDNTVLGPACGGIKVSPIITPHEIFQHARRMTLSCALMSINFGGAAAGIQVNPQDIDKTGFIKSFAKEVSPFVPEQYIAAPDTNTGQAEMAAFVEEIGDRRGATGKPGSMGGIPYELGVVGLGTGVAIETCLEITRTYSAHAPRVAESKIAIQGVDNIGYTTGKYLVNKGAKIIAISDDKCTFYDPNGIDINKIQRPFSQNSLKQCKGIKTLPKGGITKIDCDIFVSTTNANEFTEKNALTLKAKCIVEGTNPFPTVVDQIFHKNGILVLPDILTLAGGAISSYAEYNLDSQAMAFSTIESRIKETTKRAVESSQESAIPIRRVVKEIAKERILQKMEAKQ